MIYNIKNQCRLKRRLIFFYALISSLIFLDQITSAQELKSNYIQPKFAVYFNDFRTDGNFNTAGPMIDPSYLLEIRPRRLNTKRIFTIGLLDDHYTLVNKTQAKLDDSTILLANTYSSDPEFVLLLGSATALDLAPLGSARLPSIRLGLELLCHFGSMSYSTNTGGEIRTETRILHKWESTSLVSWNRRFNPFITINAEYVMRKKRRLQIPINFGYRIPVFRTYRSAEIFYKENDGPVQFTTTEKSGFARMFSIGLRYPFKKQ